VAGPAFIIIGVKVPLNLPLTVTVLSWGFNFVALKVLYGEMSAPVVALARYLVMFALLLAACFVRRESILPRKEDGGRILAFGFVAMGLYMVLFMEGMKGTTPAEGAIVLATSPIFTFLLSCLVGHERFSTSALVGSLIAFLGVTLVILGGSASGHGSVAGNLTILLSSVVWAASAVMMKPLLARYSPTQVLTMSMPGALPLLLPYGLGATLATDFARITPYAWFMFASVAVMSGFVAFICFYTGLRRIGASGAALYQYFVPPTAAFFAWIVMGKALTPVQFVGFAVVSFGVAYAGRARALALRLAASAA
jgi:drug/metabolite transporter (DMT)-like permease